MTDEHGDLEELTPDQAIAQARDERRQARVLQMRNAAHVRAVALLRSMEKRLGVNVGNVIALPLPKLPEPLDDAESNARANLLQRQKELLLSHEMTDEEFEARRKMLEEQKRTLLADS